jgi:hypothetical protein
MSYVGLNDTWQSPQQCLSNWNGNCHVKCPKCHHYYIMDLISLLCTKLSIMTLSTTMIRKLLGFVSHFYCHALCRYTKCRYAGCRKTNRQALLKHSQKSKFKYHLLLLILCWEVWLRSSRSFIGAEKKLLFPKWRKKEL